MCRIPPIEERFWSKVDQSQIITDCWVWLAYKNKDGYGVFANNKKTSLAHRVSYELLVGPISDNKELDHICSNRACVNPRHLQSVTHKENVNRGIGSLINDAKIKCHKGHDLSGDNLRINSENRRVCITCRREYDKKWKRDHYVHKRVKK